MVKSNSDIMQSRVIRLCDVAKLIGVSRPTVWRWVKSDPSFPQPFRLSGSVTAWDEIEILMWLQAKKAQGGRSDVRP